MSAHDEIRALIRHHLEGVWNSGDAEALHDTSHSHRVTSEPGHGEQRHLDHHKQAMTNYLGGVSDFHLRIDHLIVEGDMAAARFTAHGKHTGNLLGIPATGKDVHVTGLTLHRIEDGKIAQTWAEWDQLGLLRQLGATLTMPGQAGG